MAAKAKSPRAKQGHLKGMEPPSIPEIDTAADSFVEARNAWQVRNQSMVEAKAILEAMMKKNKLKKYEYDGKVVLFETSETLKVNVKKPPKEEQPETIKIGAGPNGDDDDEDEDDDDDQD